MNSIYLLPDYANPENLKNQRTETNDIYTVQYETKGALIELSETNSLIEDKYCLRLHSSLYVVEGEEDRQIAKEGMIHHHTKGHKGRHLQFRLVHEREVIRISLEPMDDEDYKNCIKEFISVAKRIIQSEGEELGDKQLCAYFFNPSIATLESHKIFLLDKIKRAFESGDILGGNNAAIDDKRLQMLKSEKHLLPFLSWKN